MNSQSIEIISANGYSILVNQDNLAWIKIKNEVLDALTENKELSEKFMQLIGRKYRFFDCNSNNLPDINTVYFSITNLCNMNCKFCTLNSGTKASIQNNLSLDSIRYIIGEIVNEFHPSTIVITGGEPTTREDFYDILDICQEYRNNCDVMLQTNGLNLDEYNVKKLIAKLDIIEISIEHMLETKHMPKLHKVLKIMQGTNIDVRLSFVIDKSTRNKVISAIDLCQQYDVVFQFRMVAAVGRAVSGDILLTDKDINNILLLMAKYLLDKHFFSPKLTHALFGALNTRKACGAFGKTLGIKPDGKVQMCGNLERDLFNYGNLTIDTIDNLKDKIRLKLQDEGLQRIFSAEYVGTCSNCIGKYFCGGACAAELENIEISEYECGTKKLYMLYLMFYYDKKSGAEENLINLITLLSKSDKKKLEKIKIYTTSINKICKI